ncbi:MAG: ABC transporter permease [Geminicoccaceae bacterium]
MTSNFLAVSPEHRAGYLLLALLLAILVAPLLATQDPTDLGRLDLMAAGQPPWWQEGGSLSYPLGTDGQGRCILSAILYGLRLSLLVGATPVLLSLTLGTLVGLWAGAAGGLAEQLAMRLADTAVALHPVLVALILAAVLRQFTPVEWNQEAGIATVIVALAVVGWGPYACTARAMTHVEERLPYVQAARLMGQSRRRVLIGHVLPNIAPALTALAIAQLAQAVFAESTLSYLGTGLPPTLPSLGGLIRSGTDDLLSGGWWTSVLPALALLALIGTIGWIADRAPRHDA